MNADETARIIRQNLRETYLGALDNAIEVLQHRNMPGAVEVVQQLKLRMLATFKRTDENRG